MAAEESRRTGKGREVPPAAADDDASRFNHRFWIAQTYALHLDCPHAACKRHRTCTRAAAPCYDRHLGELRRYVFPGLRRAVGRAPCR